MPFNADEIAALSGDRVRLGIFFNLQTAVPLRLWMAVGNIEPGVNAADAVGATYYGLGELTQVPEIAMLINGQADRADFTLSGIPDRTVRDVFVNASNVRNKPCWLGIGLMGNSWQLLGPVHWPRRGFADVVTIKQEPQTDLSAPIMRTIVLSVGSMMTGRRRRGNSYFTDQDQQRRSPGDKFFERVALYSQEVTKSWPRF